MNDANLLLLTPALHEHVYGHANVSQEFKIIKTLQRQPGGLITQILPLSGAVYWWNSWKLTFTLVGLRHGFITILLVVFEEAIQEQIIKCELTHKNWTVT